MVSRTTQWRRNKQLKKMLIEMLDNTNSLSDEKYMFIMLITMIQIFISFSWLHSKHPEVSNNNDRIDLLAETQSPEPFQSQSDLFALMNEDEPGDESDVFVDQTWLEELVDNLDPWKNVELEPIFPYPIEDNEFLLRDTNQ